MEMDAIAKRADVENMQTFTYDIVCGSNGIGTSTTIVNLLSSISALASSSVTCNSDTPFYAVSVPISTTTHWCIDSTGAKKEITTSLTIDEFVCP